MIGKFFHVLEIQNLTRALVSMVYVDNSEFLFGFSGLLLIARKAVLSIWLI